MKKCILLFLTILSYSQNKTIVPKNGAIVFEKKEIITDTLLYKKSFEKVFEASFPEIKKQVLVERGYTNIQIPDSVHKQIDQILEMVKSFSLQEIVSNQPKDIVKFHHIYNGSEIVEYISSNNNNGKSEIINTLDSVYRESHTIVMNTQEFKSETKVINGFKCYKIVMYYFDLEQPPSFNSLLNTMELWVTEDIKSMFHPFIKEREILSKYYPLEVKHSIKNIEGMFTLYKLSEFSLN